MKIRIKGNFVRYRLVQSEVRALSQGKKLVESTCFGPDESQVFSYTLEGKEGIDSLQADFDGRTIALYLPAEIAKNWYADERIGYENKVEVRPGVTLGLLLEKDFVCLDNTDEDQSDNYPNPNAVC
jgi:hypothetical protein